MGIIMKTILIVSEKPLDLGRKKSENILLATKSVFLFQEISNDITLISLENEKPIPSEETWSLLDEINDLLKKSVESERTWVYESGYHIEGGGLSQNCANVLSAMEIIAALFESKIIDEIILYPVVENLVECMLIEEIAHEKKIKLRRYSKGLRNYLVTKNFGVNPWLKCIYYWLGMKRDDFLLLKKLKNKTVTEKHDYQLGIIQASDAKKSISWTSTWIYGVKEEFDSYRLLCLNAKQAAEHFRGKGIDADIMEEWLTKGTLQKRRREYEMNLKKILVMLRKEFKFIYQNMDISKTIKYFIALHLFLDVPKAVKTDCICMDYFQYNSYQILSSHEDSNFVATKAMYFNTRKAQTKMFNREGLVLFNVQRYEPYANMIEVRFFCEGSQRYKELCRQGWKGRAYFIGDTQYIPQFAQKYTKREEADIKSGKLSVLWAPSYVVRGYTTYNTFQSNNERILRKFKDNGWELYVKFHPNQQEDQTAELYRKYANDRNIHFVDKKDSIYGWINKADVIITDKSLLVFDSIVEGKPVMVLCSPLHYSMLRRHEPGVSIYQNPEDLFIQLERLEKDLSFFADWRERTVRKQDEYFQSFMKDRDAIKDMADALKLECREQGALGMRC